MLFSDTDIRKFTALLSRTARVTIAAHTHPDGDAIGSSVALGICLEASGKDVRVILPDSVEENLRFMIRDFRPMIYSDDPAAAAARIAESDLLVCLDCAGWSRTAGMEPALRKAAAAKVLIDHHLSPETDAFDLVFSRADISSASELLYWLLRALGMPIPLPAATALLTGMTTDTNNFANSVFPSTLQMASELLSAGVDRDEILEHLYHSYPERRLRLMGRLLEQRMTITPQGAAYMILRRADKDFYGIADGDTEGFVNLPLGIDRVRMSVFLKEEADQFRVSIRSRKSLSINEFAHDYFHGGGHAQASGGKLLWPADIPGPDAAEKYLIDALEAFLN